jgi:peptidoglycan hydrolase-like protein with peptidoglycan-binding domain
MWGSALAIKWGASPKAVTLNDGKGQGNNIAVFPSYVLGICAQLDLWRSSKNYRNKPFDEAIRIWSGGNEVESYIAFVLKRVPGMTRNTVMNDAFWRSPSGIAFLKAQAWHEAGKPYPAPDADWIEAQRRVFANDLPNTSAKNVAVPTSTYSTDVKRVQSDLIALGYHEVGDADGLIGGKTRGAITAFLGDRGVIAAAGISPVLTAEIAKAKAENWSRPVAPARAYATAKDIAPKVEAVKQNAWSRFWSKVLAVPSTAGAATWGVVSNIPAANDAASPYIAMGKEYLGSVPGWVWLLIIAAVGFAIWRSTNKSEAATVADYQTGRLN